MDASFGNQIKQNMQKALHILQDDLSTIRTGRASGALVENIVVSAYEGTTRLTVKEMGTIATAGPRMLIITPFDANVIGDIEHGINAANIGVSAYIDGNLIRINIPSLTTERREEYIKLSHTKIENGRIMVRQIRHEAMSDIKSRFEEKEISEDEKIRLEKEMQKITDETIEEIDELKNKKEAELREM